MSNPTIVLLYSLNSPKCNQFRSMIKDEYMSMFKPICVDNKQVREMLQNSTTLQIKTVPCVIEIFPDGNLASYEDVKAFEWINNFMSVLDKKPAPKQQPARPQHAPPQQSRGFATKIDDVFEDDMPASGSDYLEEKPQMPGLQGQGASQSSRGLDMNEIQMQERNPNITALRGPRRSAYRGEVEDNQYMGLTSERDMQRGEINRPMRGMGHTGMNSSSLSDTDLDNDPDMLNEQPPPPRRQIPIHAGGNRVKMIEDLTPMEEPEDESPMLDDDDPSGMKIPRDDPISGGGGASGGMTETRPNRAKEKSASLKNMASSIERARKMEEEQGEKRKQGGIVRSREMAMNEPIDISL